MFCDTDALTWFDGVFVVFCMNTHMHTQNGFCSLYFASQKGYDRIVNMLLQARAAVDLQTKVGIMNIHHTHTYSKSVQLPYGFYTQYDIGNQ